MLSILKKEISSYLSSLVAYVTIGVFLLVLGLFLWVFPESSILEYGYASLESLFSTAPYLFIFLIPAVTMRSLAEERREGTFELLVTRPLTDWQIVLGKYLACVVLVLFALLPTLLYVYSVSVLGTPQGNLDTGAVTGSYIGLFLLGAAFVAIGLFASSVSKNQIIAFTIAVFICYFFYSGFDSISQLLSLQNWDVQELGIARHYESVSRGVLDTRDLVYFIILSGLFLGLTLLVITRQRQKNLRYTALPALLAGLVLIGVLSALTFTRFDFTSEKRFTLSNVSRGVMDSLPKPVQVTVYLQGSDLPGGMKRLQRATRDMLNDLQAYSHRKLRFEFANPLEGLNQQEQEQTIQSMQAQGIEPTNLSVKTDNGLSQKIIFPAAVIKAGDREIGVKLLQTRIGLSPDEVLNNSIQNLEYAFASAIQKVTSGGKPRVGFTEGHNELNDVQLNDAMKSMADGFEVGRVNLQTIPFAGMEKLKLLVIPKPDKAFTEIEKFKIDQYLMRGGHILWTIDQVSAELDSLRGHGGEQLAFPKQLNLDDQLFRYGVRLNYDLIADLNCGQIPVATGNVGGQAQIQMVPWLFYPIFVPIAQHPLVKNLEGIRSEFAGTIDTLAVKGTTKTILLTSSPYNKGITTPYTLSLQSLEQEPDPRQFRSPVKTVSVLLEGNFVSAFQNRPMPEGLNEQIQVLNNSAKPGQIIVISDGDVFKNQVASDGSPFPLGLDRYTQQTFGNKNLLLNMVDYLAGNAKLIDLRAKEVKLRLLNRARVRNEKLYWQVVNTVVPLGIVLIFAIFQHYYRKRKYAH
ncbi:gliding motility-associated ABC transporter substrate-binding protein GldG [Mucilaginibacter sp. Bleaf8]|uniref:gliding motility-associated ABC transporter substrate-binding protein GldG n=1 Tax=Mucilaginibacter sp. Bleaf8 TaxID=2834430 RepID=UPI001BCF33B5|nr:gliding motility-associated ABC transporter substrate-binding protein GldG [Mucilaginibacter sp. Bleaf8]MBS7566403.1 gliding motility-associated ABC transporter substrate-binding protein GldG [Mucilaginibacter sp. Bleaf8]